jgi:hypothetical protein
VSIQESMMLQELVRLVRDLAGRIRALEQRSPSWDPWPADILDRLERLERMSGQPIYGNIAPGGRVAELLSRIEALEAAIAAGNASDTGNEQRQLLEQASLHEGRECGDSPQAATAARTHSETMKEQWTPGGNSLGQRVVALERAFLQEQEQIRKGLARIDALEARRDPVSLHPINAQRVAHGKALRAAISDIVQADPGATGPRVIEALRASHAGKLPSLRTVRWHLAAIRGNGNSLAALGESATQTPAESGC